VDRGTGTSNAERGCGVPATIGIGVGDAVPTEMIRTTTEALPAFGGSLHWHPKPTS
jgi:hypothetical protein